MADWAHKWTDKQLEALGKRFQSIYAQAENEVAAKLKKHIEAFAPKDEKKKKLVESGEMTQDAYNKWRRTQVMTGKRWQELRDNMASDYVRANQLATSAINGYLPDVYAENFNWSTYEIEKGINAGTSFTLYDRQTVERIMRDDPELLKPLSPDKAKDMRWNKQQLNAAVTQGILQGESIPKIAKRIIQIGERDKVAAVRNARTAITAAQNAGRVNGYKRAEDMGIELEQEWIATLDRRTRHSHRMLDGMRVKVGEEFPNRCKYPGDPDGPASEIYNCRCTLIAALDVFTHDASDLSLRYDENLEDMTYEEWKYEHEQNEEVVDTEKSNIDIGSIDDQIRKWQEFSDSSMRLEDWAKAEEEIEKLQKQKQELERQNKRREDERIKSEVKQRMIDNGWFDNGKYFISEYDFSNTSAKNLLEIENAYAKVFEKYPQLKGKFAGITQWDYHSENAAASTYMNRGGVIELNPKYWNSNEIYNGILRNFEHGFTVSNTIEGMFDHEIGHAIDAYIGMRWDIDKTKYIKTVQGNIKTLSETKFMNNVFKTAGIGRDDVSDIVSIYATYSDRELFAELFSAHMTGSKDNELIRAFGDELDKLIGGIK